MRSRRATLLIERHRVDGPDPNYWRVWLQKRDGIVYCVADGTGRIRSWLLAAALRRLAR